MYVGGVRLVWESNWRFHSHFSQDKLTFTHFIYYVYIMYLYIFYYIYINIYRVFFFGLSILPENNRQKCNDEDTN